MMLMERTGGSDRTERASGEPGADGVSRATGRSREGWFAVLDEWGAVGRPYREIADWLTGEQGMSAWWAQKLIVEYEQARGVRPPGVRRDGTFEVGASKTIRATAGCVFGFLAAPDERGRWLEGVRLSEFEAELGRSVTFAWPEDSSRVTIELEPKGDRTLVVVRHDRIRATETAERARAFWRARLETLKTLLDA